MTDIERAQIVIINHLEWTDTRTPDGIGATEIIGMLNQKGYKLVRSQVKALLSGLVKQGVLKRIAKPSEDGYRMAK